MPKEMVIEPEEDPVEGPFIPIGLDEATIESIMPSISPTPFDRTALKERQEKTEKAMATTASPSGIKETDVMDPSLTLYDSFMLEAGRQILVDYQRHTPLYIASIGAHILNLFSMVSCGYAEYGEHGKVPQKDQNNRCFMRTHKPTVMAIEGGRVKDLRLHIMSLGAPGVGKGVFPQQFIERNYSLIPQSLFPSHFFSKLSGAGLFGTVKSNPRTGHPMYSFGALFDYCSGIVGVEEFNLVKSATQASYNAGFEDLFLGFLERGFVECDLGTAAYSYSVGTTGWFGNQSDRAWFGSGESGLGRRLALDYTFMTDELNASYAEARRQRALVTSSAKIRDYFGKRIRFMADNFNVETVKLPADYYSFISGFRRSRKNPDGLLHFEESQMDKVAMGYNLMKYWYPGCKTLDCKMDNELKAILERQVNLRRFMFAHDDLLDAEIELRMGSFPDGVLRDELKMDLHRLGGFSSWKINRKIDDMTKQGRLLMSGNRYNPLLRYRK